MRIEIDDQHPLADRRKRGTEIDRGGGLADAALLVGQRQDARMADRACRFILLINLINYGHARCHRLSRIDRAARSGRVRRSSPLRRCGWNANAALFSNI